MECVIVILIVRVERASVVRIRIVVLVLREGFVVGTDIVNVIVVSVWTVITVFYVISV